MPDVLLTHKSHTPLLAISLLFLCLACIVAAYSFLGWSLQYLLSALYVVFLLIAFLLWKKWRLGILFLFVLGAPPFIDYELAIVGQTAFRKIQGLRPTITEPIFSAYDVLLLIGLLLFAAHRLRSRRSARMPMWFLFPLAGLAFFTIASAIHAIFAFPQYFDTALAGLAGALRVPGIAIMVLLCLEDGFWDKETALALSAGVILFVLESVFVTFVKSGGFVLGSTQVTGLLPGSGASGAILVLVFPSIVGQILVTKPSPQRGFLVIAGFMALGYAFLTYSRAVFLGILCRGIILTLGGLRLRGKGRIWPFAISAALLGWFVFQRASSYFTMKFTVMLSGEASGFYNLARRLDYWRLAIELTRENWQFGIGPLMWGMAAQGFGSHAHNAFLQYFAENGVVAGLCLCFVTLYPLLRSAIRQRQSLQSGAHASWRLGVLAGLSGYLITQQFENSLGNVRMAIVFWVMLITLVFLEFGRTARKDEAFSPDVS